MSYNAAANPSPPKPCEHCGNIFHRRIDEAPGRYARRKFCSAQCNGLHSLSANSERAERERLHRLAVIEDLEWILGTDSPEHIAERLGYNEVKSLERSLRRWGRLDLVARLISQEAVA